MTKSRKFTATIGGGSYSVGPSATFPTIRECRQWAESFGNTADWCAIDNIKRDTVANHRRDPNGNGMRWYRAS